MKTTKKLLSILLALVMTLSMAGLAFAEDETTEEPYNWVRIPTSADGLESGGYYLDWSAYAGSVGDPDAPSDLIVPYLAALNAGEWYIDMDKAALKGTYTIPAGAMNNPEAQTLELPPEASRYVLPQTLKAVDLTWEPVSFTTEGLRDGDYYLDVDAARAEEIRGTFREIYVNPYGGAMRVKMIQTITAYDMDGNTVTDSETWILPLHYNNLHNNALDEAFAARMQEICASIKQYRPVAEPDEAGDDTAEDGKDDAAKGLAALWEKIVAFFKAVDNFFRRIFGF